MVRRTVGAAQDVFRCAVLGPDLIHFAPIPSEDILNFGFVNCYAFGKGIKSHIFTSVVRSTTSVWGTNMAPMDVLTSEAEEIPHSEQSRKTDSMRPKHMFRC